MIEIQELERLSLTATKRQCEKTNGHSHMPRATPQSQTAILKVEDCATAYCKIDERDLFNYSPAVKMLFWT